MFFIYPAGMVVKQAFEGPHGFTLEFFAAIFHNPIYREGLWNSFALGAASTLAALAIAFPLALVGHRYDFFGKPALGVLVLAPMILPPFVGAVGVKQMLGVNGAFNAALITAGLMDAAAPLDWLARRTLRGHRADDRAQSLSDSLHEHRRRAVQPRSGDGAGGGKPRLPAVETLFPHHPAAGHAGRVRRCVDRVHLGLHRARRAAGVRLSARTASVQIFDGLKGLDKNPIPYALTAVLLIVAATVFTLSKFVHRPLAAGHRAAAARAAPSSLRLRGWQIRGLRALFLSVFMLAAIPHLGVLLLSLAGRWYGTVVPDQFTLRHYLEALGNGLVVPSIQNSLLYAGCATLVALVIGLSVAWVVVRSDLKFRGVLDALVMLPLAVPGLVMAFGYLALSQEGKPFYFLVGAGGSPFMLLVIAYAIRRLPYVVRSAVAGLQQSNPMLEEAASSLGATPARTLRRVAIPLIGANLAAGCILAFAFAMLEVSDSLILAQQAQHFPITKAIYTLLSTLGNGTELAAALGVWAMVFLSVAIMGAAILGGKRGGLFKL